MSKDKHQMKRTVIDTADNSKTLLINNTDVTYHSRHGALTESNHIFINHGLKSLPQQKNIKVFEMGFGTGLNAILTYDFALKNNINLTYHTIEKYPITDDELNTLNLNAILNPELHSTFELIHDGNWDELLTINQDFEMLKYNADILEQDLANSYYDIIFFDAFGPKFQPDLWQPEVLKKMYESLKQGGTFVTYCAQGQFKRDLKSVGFDIEPLPGPPGKREITRGIKC